MRVIDTRTSVPFDERIRDEAAPTDTVEQIEARAAELDRTIGENDARRAEGNHLVNQPSIHFGGVQLPELPGNHAPLSGAEIATHLRKLADDIRPTVHDITLTVSIVRTTQARCIGAKPEEKTVKVATFALATDGTINSATVPWAFSPGDKVVFSVENA